MIPRKLVHRWREAASKMPIGIERKTLLRCAAALEKSIDDQMQMIEAMIKIDTPFAVPVIPIRDILKPDEISISNEEIARRRDMLDDTVNSGGSPWCPPKIT